MLKINYSAEDKVLDFESNLNSIVLTNKKGGYLFSSLSDSFSKFNGLFFPLVNSKTKEWEMVRTLESIGIPQVPDKVESNLSDITLYKGDSKEVFYLNHSDSLIYDVQNYKGKVPIVLDAKKIYDDSTEGRIYSISKSKGCYVIAYSKFKDNSLSELDYKFYIAIKTNAELDLVDNWLKRDYPFDASRGEFSEKWVFHAFDLNVSKKSSLVLSYSTKKNIAVKKALEVFENKNYVKKMKLKYFNSLSQTSLKLSKIDLLAYRTAVCSLDNLICEIGKHKGIFAGLPWFFHFWSRDELISSGALIKEGHYALVAKIIKRWLGTGAGRISNRFPSADLGSADSIGWLYFRFDQLLATLISEKQIDEFYSRKELNKILLEAKKRLNLIELKYSFDGLIRNDALETWMDTGEEVGDLRSGLCVEIQALHLAIYNFIINLSDYLKKDNKEFVLRKEKFIEIFRSKFFVKGMLKDKADDSAIRPNIFIAAFVAPELLSKKEWIKVFEIALAELLIEGRVLTIPKSHFLFVQEHSGIGNESYHRGDTWYWLDNLVALVLSNFGKTKFKKEISSIKSSTLKALFEEGAVACLAEISSASQHESKGCLSQAWSYAMFIEFMNS